MSPLTTVTNDTKANVQDRGVQNAREGQSAQAGFAPLSLDSHLLTPNNMLVLQRSIGNKAIVRMLRGQSATGSSAQAGKAPRRAIMPKLQVGPVNDPFEREADAMAAQVMRKPLPSPVQRDSEEEEEESVQLKRSEVQRHHDEDETVQTKRHALYTTKRDAAIQRTSNHHSGCGCGSCHQMAGPKQLMKVQRVSHSPGCNCAECSGGVQRSAPEVKKDGSFEADDGLSSQVSKLQGSGRPLPDKVRGDMESRFGADFSGVRVHTGSEAVQMNRSMHADAFTYRQNIAFNANKYNPGSGSGQRLLAHELTHTLQQTGGLQRQHSSNCKCTNCAGVRRKAKPKGRNPIQRKTGVKATNNPNAVVQRHSSWEHKLIGDLKPQDLAIIGAGRDSKRVLDEFGGGTVDAGGVQINHEDVMHVMEQEIRRLRYFQTNPLMPKNITELEGQETQLKMMDKSARVAQKKGFMAKALEAAAPEWQVKLVGIASKDGRMFGVTYGELNTLADFYGSVDEMRDADSAFLERLIRGVRQSTLEQMVRLYAELKGVKEKKAKKLLGIKNTKYGKDAIAMGNGVMDELKLMGLGPIGTKKKGVAGKSETGYKETLARNACHFPPESWHAWANFHKEARKYALMSYQASQLGPTHKDNAAGFLNEALLQNGFGDHYLQDSYASGHLINKTQIMQWYVEWLDQNSLHWDAHRDKNWRHMQQMGYNQKGLSDPEQYNKDSVDKDSTNPNRREARNPQSVANAGGDWEAQFDALGLKAPSALSAGIFGNKLLRWWQAEMITKSRLRSPREKTYKTLMAKAPGNVNKGLHALLKQGIVRPKKYSTRSMSQAKGDTLVAKDSDVFVLRSDYVPKNVKTVTELNQKATANGGSAYKKMGKAVVFEDYRRFMQSSYLQKATNALHDYYCKNGLNVYSGDSAAVFKVYGDDNMLQKESAKGLLHSGQTARMSQQAIENVATTGNDGGITTDNIVERFPEGIEVSPNGEKVSLKDWHDKGKLKNMCFTKVFPSMSKVGFTQISNKFAPGVLGSSLGNVTPAKPHGNESF